MRGALVVALVACCALSSPARAQCVGEGCIGRIAPPGASTPAVDDPAVGIELMWRATPPDGALHRPRISRRHDVGLLVAGLSAIGFGFVGGVLVAAIDEATQSCRRVGFVNARSCESWPLSLAPLGGAIFAGATTFAGIRTDYMSAAVAGPLLALTQLVGLVLVIIAVHGSIEDLARASVTIAPIATTTDLGLSVRVLL